MSGSIKIKIKQNIALLTLNRPKDYNALNLELLEDLTNNLKEVAEDDTLKGIIITGKGRAFCSGGDLKWIIDSPEDRGNSFHILATQFHHAVTAIRTVPKPVLAAINGTAAGGGFSLALCCDFRVMDKSAILRQIYTSHGLSIDGGGTFTLPRIVGHARAMEIVAFDEPITSEIALNWGMVTKVVEDGKSVEEAIKTLNQLSNKSIYSFGVSKKLLNDSFNNTLETQLELESESLRECADHPDGKEGVDAFIEKRNPEF